MTDAFICDAIRTPIGRYGGSLAQIRTDDLVLSQRENYKTVTPQSTGAYSMMLSTVVPIKLEKITKM
ncbi:MAG: hypothetical protein P8J68_01845 [Arenicellaceae bacterium]|nr:hypothetical protein [Arenicellaceae bacterium]